MRQVWRSVAILLLLSLASIARAQSATQPTTQPSTQAAGNDFAFHLYQQLAGTTPAAAPNLIFSPASVRRALAMAYAGAAGRTADQIAAVADLPNAAIAHLDSHSRTLQMANALWYEQSLTLRTAFKTALDTQFTAALQPVDFAHAGEAARHIINQWVETQTHDRIRNLLPANAVTPSTRLILANAVYFKADWRTPFDARATRPQPFWIAENKSTSVQMMHHHFESLPYVEDATAQAVQLPYADSDIVMTIFLPRQRLGASELETQLDAAEVQSLLRSLTPTNVILAVPRFTAETEVRLKPVLAAMGMADAFDPARADFSLMTADPRSGFVIDDVYHKAFVAVDEVGTEAAAATGIAMVPTVARRGPPPRPVIADHPFLYLLHDVKTDEILFIGTLTDPSR